jgi:hypothetical protein
LNQQSSQSLERRAKLETNGGEEKSEEEKAGIFRKK